MKPQEQQPPEPEDNPFDVVDETPTPAKQKPEPEDDSDFDNDFDIY